MSWATIATAAKDVNLLSAKPKQVVFAPFIESDDAAVNGDNANNNNNNINSVTAHGSKPIYSSVNNAIPEYQKGLLILDANAFIKGMDGLNDVADVLVTTPQVVAEVRDHAARELLNRLPHALHILEPSKGALAAVVAVAGKTGDFGAMSRTDICVCALALDCCKATDTLLPPIEPRPAQINSGEDYCTDIATGDFTNDGGNECDNNSDDGNADDGDGDDHEDDDEGWITPENIHMFGPDGKKATGERFKGGVACVTSDYAMQNTLMHLGVPIIGPHGMRIKELRNWLLRCTSCFAIATDTTRQFCGMCGSGDTLRRVQYVLTSSGKCQLLVNFRKQISTRGTIYKLPKPRGGRHGTNRRLVLREDQLAHVIRGTTSAKLKEKHAMRGISNDDELAAFGEAPKQHKRDPNQPRMFSSYHKYNVNEKRKVRAARRK